MDIRIQLDDVTTVKKRLRVEVPAEVAANELNQVAGEYRKHARLPGFRPGKAPLQLIKRHFKKSIRSDVLQKLVPESYGQALEEKGFQPLGEPSVQNLSFKEGASVTYEANFEIQPPIELPDYKGLEARAAAGEVSDEDVDQELEKLRESHSRLVSIEGQPVQEGHYAVIELVGEYTGDEEGDAVHEPIQEESLVVKVGDQHTHEAFNSALLGMQVAEEKQFDVAYADDYPEQNLAGHKVHFNITVTDIKRKELPELSDDLARDAGEFDSLAEMKCEIKERLSEEREKNRDDELKRSLLEGLAGTVSFELPDVLVEDQTDSMIRGIAGQMASEGVDPASSNVDWMKVRTDFRDQAEKRVRENMILGEVGRRENIEISDQELTDELKRMADSMGQPEEKVRQYFQQADRTQGLRSQLIRQKALDLLLTDAKVLEE